MLCSITSKPAMASALVTTGIVTSAVLVSAPSTLETIAFTFAELFDVGFGFLNRALSIFANLSGVSARRRLCIYYQAFFRQRT